MLLGTGTVILDAARITVARRFGGRACSLIQPITVDTRPPLSPRQRDTFEFIERYIAEHGYPPCIREIAAAMGIRSTNGAADHVRALEKKGYIERAGGRSRAIRVVRPKLGDDGELEREAEAAVHECRNALLAARHAAKKLGPEHAVVAEGLGRISVAVDRLSRAVSVARSA